MQPLRDTPSEPIPDQRSAFAARLLERVSLLAALLLLGYLAALAPVVLQTGAWQAQADAGLTIFIFLILLLTWRATRKKKTKTAGYLAIAALMLAPVSGLFLTRTDWSIAAAGILAAFILSVLLASSWEMWLFSPAIYAAYLIVLRGILPWKALSINDYTLLAQVDLWTNVAFTAGLVIFTLLSVRFRSLRYRLLYAFAAMSVVPLILVLAVSTITSYNTILNRTYNQLEAIASIEETRVNEWLTSLQQQITFELARDQASNLVPVLLSGSSDSPQFSEAYTTQQTRFRSTLQVSYLFETLMLMDTGGRVVLSTDPNLEGKNLKHEEYFQMGLAKPTIELTSFDPVSGNPHIYISQPVKKETGEIIGVIGGLASTLSLNQIMGGVAGLGESGEVYLVNADLRPLTQIAQTISEEQQAPTIQTEGAKTVIAQEASGRGEYAGRRGPVVAGVYRYIPGLNAGLMVEMERNEAVSSILAANLISFAAAALLVALAMFITVIITRRISGPLVHLAQTADRVSAGELNLTVPVESDDEVGVLARSFNAMTGQLRRLVTGLETSVSDRTQDLERRTRQLQTAGEIARDITSSNDLDDLLNQAVRLIRDRFGFYHAGIFLLDEPGEWAVLRSASGDAGRQMLEAGHRLKVGEVGLVGYATGSGKARIALNVGADAAHFQNPFLPDTRSEIALPLIVRGKVIGALDVQSVEENAFGGDDVTVLQTMTDQLAIAIDNIRLIGSLNRSVQDLEKAYGQYTEDAWRTFLRSSRKSGKGGVSGYRFDNHEIAPVEDTPAESIAALSEAKTVIEAGADGASTRLAVPIRLRDQVLGVLDLSFGEARLTEETVSLVEEASARLALVLENARLLQEAQRLAAREQQINLISSQVRSSANTDAILQNTVRELGKALGATRTFIQIANLTTQPVEEPARRVQTSSLAGNGGRPSGTGGLAAGNGSANPPERQA